MRGVSDVVDDLHDTIEEGRRILDSHMSDKHKQYLFICFSILRLQEELSSFVGWKEARKFVSLAFQDIFSTRR